MTGFGAALRQWPGGAAAPAYRDLSADYYARRNPEGTMHHIAQQANALGLTVRFDPIPA